MRRICRSAIPAIALLLTCGFAGAQELFTSNYVHSVYNACSPGSARIYGGRLSHDLSDVKWWRQLYGEMSALGINQTAPLVTYGLRAIYPTALPELHQSEDWAELGMDPLQVMLDVCAETGISCFPAVWLYRDASPELAEKVIRELVERYGDHPAFGGIVPGVEANPTYDITSEDFVRLSSVFNELKPELEVMDYPNGPFSPTIVQTIVARSQSGEVDIQNVQFHPSDRRWESSFAFARGLMHLVIGITPGTRSICHTHYKYGGGVRWIQLDDLYRVHQAATITATPHGTSIFLFTGCMYGRVSSTNYDDPLPRRLQWYRGILAVQRMLPWLQGARRANAVAIMVPRHIRESSLELIEAAYMPLAEAKIGAHMFVDDTNIGERTQAIILRGLQWCSPAQVRLVQDFVAEGGAACVFYLPGGEELGQLGERAQAVVGETYQVPWEPAGLDPQFAAAIGLDEATGAVEDAGPREVAYREGYLYVAPLGGELPEGFLADWAREHAPRRAIAIGLSDEFVVDTWRASGGGTDSDVVMFMGTEAGAEAQNVRVSVPTARAEPNAWLLTPDTIQPLAANVADGRATVTVPRLRDEFNALILSESTYPFIVPERRMVRCRTGETVQVQVGILNALDRPLTGSMQIRAPAGWEPPEPASIDVDLEPGGSATVTSAVTVPVGAERAPHFLRLELSGLLQRVMLFPEDGPPQRFTDTPEEELAAAERTSPILAPPRPRPTIGEEWLEVVADAPDAMNPRANSPGVCFLPGPEWDAPAMRDGKMARYAERLPRLGGPNFLINDPPPADVEVRLTYRSEGEGTVGVYDGEQYHTVVELPATDEWATVTARVPHEPMMTPGADRSQHPGLNILCAIECDRVWVHRIEVRAAPPEE